MKLTHAIAVAALVAPLTAGAGEMKGMDTKGMDMKGDMKAMDMGPTSMAKGDKSHMTHKAVGVVKKVDGKAGSVTLDHEPVKSMKWPAMTMAFQVKDKAMLGKLAEGKKVNFEFEQKGKDYVITDVKTR